MLWASAGALGFRKLKARESMFRFIADTLGCTFSICPKQFTVGFSLREKKAGRDMPWPCPPCVRLNCVRFGGASKPPIFVRLVSALAAWPWPRLQALSLSAFSPLLPGLPCCPLCPPCVRALCFLCPLVVRSLSALCRFLAGSMVWLWPGLCQLCVRSLVFAPLSVLSPLLSALVEVFVATPLPAVCLVTVSRQCSCLP